MIYLQLFWEFFQIGLFAVGGGMATLPFLQRLSESTGWFPPSLITDMIAISESTPGPIGINMATYVGFTVAGVPGGILATLGEILPSILIVVLVSKSLERFRSSPLVEGAFYGLRPAVTGLIAAAGFDVLKKVGLIDWNRLLGQAQTLAGWVDLPKSIFFIVIFLCIRKFKKSPVVYIAIAAVVGIVLQFAPMQQ